MKKITICSKTQNDAYDARLDLINRGWVVDPIELKGFWFFQRWEANGYYSASTVRTSHFVKINNPV